MRWVDRRAEPESVADYRLCYTQQWVDHFCNRMGQRHHDLESHWRDFRVELGNRFLGKCGYCERPCAGIGNTDNAPTVDHFKPLSQFPNLSYEWTNWVYSCRRCNRKKDDNWPPTGYIDPCADVVDERPERYLEYVEASGEIKPKASLALSEKVKAQNTIDDIGLNLLDILFYRIDWIREFKSNLLKIPQTERQPFIDLFTSDDQEYAGTIRMLVEKLRESEAI